jgi:hypothetical protein
MPAGFNRKDGLEKLVLTDEIRDALVKQFAGELKACADELGGPAAEWPKKYAV